MTGSSRPPGPVKGAATLGITLLLFAAASLIALFATRDMLLAQRISARQVHAAQAFEAAEAGLDWALAMLNDDRRIDAACQPTANPNATSFRRRFLVRDPERALLVPTGLAATCTLGGGLGWSCHCATADEPGVTIAATEAASFRVTFLPAERSDLVRVNAVGCTSAAGECVPGSIASPDAVAHHQTAYALLSALPVPPVAAVTLRGSFDAGTAAVVLQNTDPETGTAVHAGGTVLAPSAHLAGPPGTPLAAAVVDRDAALAASTPDRFFASHFGADRSGWARLPTVRHMRCDRECGRELEAAIAALGDLPTIHVEGDLDLSGPLILGSPAHPVLLVVSGDVHIDGEVGLHGVLYGASLRWDGAGNAAFVRGALLLDTDCGGQAAPVLARDAAVLDALALESGSFVRINGAWRDF
jgi:Tfp pilus assembly protein PilX